MRTIYQLTAMQEIARRSSAHHSPIINTHVTIAVA
jgi:hypothetical protein